MQCVLALSAPNLMLKPHECEEGLIAQYSIYCVCVTHTHTHTCTHTHTYSRSVGASSLNCSPANSTHWVQCLLCVLPCDTVLQGW